MPIYRYEVLNEEDQPVEIFEAEQRISEPPLTRHPITGERMRKLVDSAHLNLRYAGWNSKMEAGNLARHGFTRYEKDRLTGRYHKTNQGNGPAHIDPPR